NAQGPLMASQAHVAAVTNMDYLDRRSGANEVESNGSNLASKDESAYALDLYRTITTKFGIRFNGHAGEWQDPKTGWEVSRERLEAIFKSLGVERKQAWDAWAQTEGKTLFGRATLEEAGFAPMRTNP